MSLTGIMVIAIFTFLAVAAPLITPYNPQGTIVSGALNPPIWYSQLIGGTGWSQNTEFSGLTVSAATGVQLIITPGSQTEDSVNFTLKPPQVSSPSSVLITKTLTYPFDGPPQAFIGKISVTTTGLENSGGAPGTVYINGAGKDWTLWKQTFITGSYGPPTDLSVPLNFGTQPFTAAEQIFSNSKKADFTYGLSITVPAGVSQASFSVRNFRMILVGNTWGLFGTDDGGHDLFTQFTYGAQVSLIVGLLAAFIGIGVGLVVGLLAGYLGRVVDEVLMRFTDMMLVIPGLPLLIVLVAVLGPSLFNIIGVLGFLGWMGFARVIRSQVLSLRERPFIEAAKASGAGTGYITMRHIFPNIVSLTYVNLALSVPGAIVGEAALSFLGLGPQTVVSWGQMLELAHGASSNAGLLWYWIVPPGIGIALLSLSFILIGYALDEMFNPRLRRRR